MLDRTDIHPFSPSVIVQFFIRRMCYCISWNSWFSYPPLKPCERVTKCVLFIDPTKEGGYLNITLRMGLIYTFVSPLLFKSYEGS
jgi:hypothetical protein